MSKLSQSEGRAEEGMELESSSHVHNVIYTVPQYINQTPKDGLTLQRGD